MIVPRPSGFLGLSRANDLVIPWENIECIGTDTILVRITEGIQEHSHKEKGIKRYL